MKYILANKDKCETYGVNLKGTQTIDGKALINEYSLMRCSPEVPGSSLEEKAKSIGGEIHSEAEVINMIENKK